MENVLPTAMHRRITLLNLLHLTANWVSLDDLADKTKASKKTLLTDVQYIEERWPEIISFEYQNNNSIRLLEAQNHSIHDIYTEILRESNAFALLEAIFFNPYESGEYWENKFYLSNSSLYRLALKLEGSLNKREMQLNRTPFRIEGNDERKIRTFFRGYFLEAYGIHEWPFPFDKNLVFDLVGRLNEDFELQFNDSQLVDFAFGIAVTIVRERQGHLLQEDTRLLENREKVHSKLQKYRLDIEKIVEPLKVELPDNWYDDFSSTLYWWEFAWDNPQEEVRITEQGNAFIDTVVRALNVTIDEKSREKILQLFLRTYGKYKIYPYKRYIIYNREWFNSYIVQQHLVVFSKIVAKALQELETKTKVPWYSVYYDDMLCGMMIYWKELASKMDQLRHQVKVGVFSDLGVDHAQALGEMLARSYGEKISLTIQEESRYSGENKKIADYEIYVANYTLTEVPPEKLFVIEDIPSFKNLGDLRQLIERNRLVLPRDIPYLQEK